MWYNNSQETMPYRVVLVDDDRLDVDCMKDLVPWDDLELELAGSFNSSTAAFNFIAENNPDILILDIKMPVMSGLELCEKAKELNPDVMGLFISGHEDFQYARKALEMNAYGYLLKPIDIEELKKTLEVLRDELNQKKLQKQFQNTYRESNREARQQAVRNIIQGVVPINCKDYCRRYGIRLEGSSLRVLIVVMKDPVVGKTVQPQSERSNQWNLFRKRVYEKLETLDIIEYCDLAPERIAFILRDGTNAFQTADTVNSFLRNQADIAVSIGIGDMVDQVSGLVQSYRSAEHAVFEALVTQKEVGINNTAALKGKEMQLHRDYQEKILSCILRNNMEALDTVLTALFQWIRSYFEESGISIPHNIIINLFFRLSSRLDALNYELNRLVGNEIELGGIIMGIIELGALKLWTKHNLYKIADFIYQSRNGHERKLADKIDAYVKNNLGAPLSLSAVAVHFSYSPNYLGHLFKRITGKSFSEYLINTRMERACEFLTNSDLLVYEIAEKTGYRNVGYFNRQFKERYGISPGQMRKKSR